MHNAQQGTSKCAKTLGWLPWGQQAQLPLCPASKPTCEAGSSSSSSSSAASVPSASLAPPPPAAPPGEKRAQQRLRHFNRACSMLPGARRLLKLG